MSAPEESESSVSVATLGEESLVSRLVAKLPSHPGIIAGPGDDCAVVMGEGERWQLLKTDTVIEGVHFYPGTDPVLVGRKAMSRTLSDIAAMGGRPDYALISLAVDEARSVGELEGWYDGLVAAASRFDCAIVGGETARLNGPGAVITVSMTGSVLPEHCLLRSGARPGELIVVTGRLGGSLESGRHLTFTPRLREAQWLVANTTVTAMMDLSDGLGSDLPRLAEASGVGYRVEPESLPCHVGATPEGAIRDGEDYELLFTLSAEHFHALLPSWTTAFPETPLTAIGEIIEGESDTLIRGWEHFRNQ